MSGIVPSLFITQDATAADVHFTWTLGRPHRHEQDDCLARLGPGNRLYPATPHGKQSPTHPSIEDMGWYYPEDDADWAYQDLTRCSTRQPRARPC